jgi:hypothetical protein
MTGADALHRCIACVISEDIGPLYVLAVFSGAAWMGEGM